MKFKEIQVHPDLLKAIEDMGFEDLTTIQEQCLTPGLNGRDIAGISQTGTGKTVAFLLPALHGIFEKNLPGPAALIVTPTRELCLQIAEEAEKLTRHHPTKICPVYGGAEYRQQEQLLAKDPEVIVATPGRLIDYIKQGKIKTETLRYLVLDEADRMFDMGFIRDVRYIMRHVPTEAQCMLFSATLSYYVMRLASDFMKDPVEVRIESETVAVDKIDQHIVHLGREERDPYLVNLMREQENIRAIVFTNYKQAVRRISNVLRKYGIAAAGISSLLDQKKRIRLLKDFKLGRHSVLVATDVASRGLDVEDITHVFNYDLPQDSESYVHRIGRTARAGRSGTSISFCSESDYENLPRIEKYLEHKIPVMEVRDELLQFPQGVEPFREARGADAFDDTAETKEQNDDSAESGRSRSGRRRRRGGRGRGERSESTNEQSANTRSNEGRGRRNRDEAPAQLDERDLEGMTVRERDRAAVLGRLNTRDDQSGSGEGNDGNRNRRRRRRGRRSGRRDDQNTESTSREERPNRNQNERDGSGGERSSGNRRRRGGRRQNRDRDREGTGRNRDGRSRRDSGSQSGRRDSTKRAATTEKKGLFDRIRGWLRKS